MQSQSQSQHAAWQGSAGETRLSEAGRRLADEVARRHGVSPEAAATLLIALRRGGGGQAQFSHSDLGGMGQWSRNGMIMVGDMFDNALKARVDALCTELSGQVGEAGLFAPEARASTAWWPPACGTPSSTGSANDLRYAFFPQTRRLAILRAGGVELYDTGDHAIHGVSSQQQNGSQDLTFTSQHGTVRLHELTLVGEAAPTSRPAPAPTRARPADAAHTEASKPTREASSPDLAPARGDLATADDIFAKIERLHALQQKGILSEAEFAETKKALLARL